MGIGVRVGAGGRRRLGARRGGPAHHIGRHAFFILNFLLAFHDCQRTQVETSWRGWTESWVELQKLGDYERGEVVVSLAGNGEDGGACVCVMDGWMDGQMEIGRRWPFLRACC